MKGEYLEASIVKDTDKMNIICNGSWGENKRYFLILLLYIFFPSDAYCYNENIITISVGLTVQPYVIESNNSGFEIDIVKEALLLEGYKAQFIYQPLLRTKISFKRGDVDAVMTIKPEYPEVRDAFVSKEYITYHNFAITLRSQRFKIITISDLNDKKVQAFQQAKLALGNEFEFMAKSNLTYLEQANQQNQIIMLFLKRADALIIDKRIFRYHCNKLKQKQTNDKMFGNIMFNDPVVFHDLFESTSYHMAFKSEIVKDAFDRGLKKIRTSGRYERLIELYLVE